MKIVKWGIIGPGKIARQFANDLTLVKDAQLTAVASRNSERATAFAAAYNIPNVFFNYEDLFKSDLVDVVYIATPHVFHSDLAIRAMEYGKHVLCEKPLGVNFKEVNAMVNAAAQHQVFLMEALWSRFNPTIKEVKALADQGELGELSYINADFAFYGLDRPLESRLFNLDLAGGSLLDIGIYPVFLAYLFLGMPETISATATFNDHGAEIQTAMVLNYPKAKAILYSSFMHNARMSAEIAGTKGSVRLLPRFHESQGYHLVTDDKENTVKLPLMGRGYYYEIVEVNQCIKKNALQSNLWSHKDSKNLILLLDEIRTKAKISFPFEDL